jgi:hypothetical protein
MVVPDGPHKTSRPYPIIDDSDQGQEELIDIAEPPDESPLADPVDMVEDAEDMHDAQVLSGVQEKLAAQPAVPALDAALWAELMAKISKNKTLHTIATTVLASMGLRTAKGLVGHAQAEFLRRMTEACHAQGFKFEA